MLADLHPNDARFLSPFAFHGNGLLDGCADPRNSGAQS